MRMFVLLFAIAVSAGAQTLQLPVRNSSAPTGSQIYPVLSPLSRTAREDTLFQHIVQGNVPDFLRTMVKVSTSRIINGTSYTLQYFVTPDYFAVGHDTDYFLMPMTPILAQKVANYLQCTLPTAKMVDQIYTTATVKLRPQPIPWDDQMVNVPRFKQHNDSVKALRTPLLAQFPLGSLIGGTKKDVIIDKKIYSWIKGSVPKPVVIYGWHQLNGVPIQSTYNGHGESYVDYSHGIRLVNRMAKINGAEISLIDIVKDSVYYPLICDTVLMKPFYGSLTQIEGRLEKRLKQFELQQNFPNPFNPSTQITFSLLPHTSPNESGEGVKATLKIYNAVGQEIATLVDGELDAGTYSVRFGDDAPSLASGVYFYRLQTPSFSQTQKMVLIR
ncbi:MAG: T9SS type A sorting domain-containing protein [Bacteroidetes bacterium]|nr:T9SS type A sorting domain-containing protein [Bacteroidota bacterium]